MAKLGKLSVCIIATMLIPQVGIGCAPPISAALMSEESLHGYVKPNIGRVYVGPETDAQTIGSATLFNGRHGFVLTARHVLEQARQEGGRNGTVFINFPELGLKERLEAKSIFELESGFESDLETRKSARDIAVLKISSNMGLTFGADISPLAAVDNQMHHYFGYGGQTDRPLGASSIAGYQQDCTLSYRVSTAQGDSGGGVFDNFGRLVGVTIQNGVRSTQGVFVPTNCFVMEFGNSVLLESDVVGEPIYAEVVSALRGWNGDAIPSALKVGPSHGLDWFSNIDLMRFVHERYASVVQQRNFEVIDLPTRQKCYLEQAIHFRLGPEYNGFFLITEVLSNSDKLSELGIEVNVNEDGVDEDESSNQQALDEDTGTGMDQDALLEVIESRLGPEDTHLIGLRLLEASNSLGIPDSATASMETFDLVHRIFNLSEAGFESKDELTAEQEDMRFGNAMEVLQLAERVREINPKKIPVADQERFFRLAQSLQLEHNDAASRVLTEAHRSTLSDFEEFFDREAERIALGNDACSIKVGVLHSLSGTMAVSEATLKDTMEFLIEQRNEAGGVLGCHLETVVVDPASDWPLFAEKARELLTVHEVDVIFGNWTSVSRKSVLPVIEELNGLLFYPVQYEGEESSKNVFYTGAAPNQQAIPATDYFLEELGVEKFALLGTDYVYPRTTNNILEAYLQDKGIDAEDIFVNYTPFDHSDWSNIVADVVALGSDGKKVGVISTISGSANVGFYKELAAAGIAADDIPVLALSVGEEELAGLDTSMLVGHLAARNYFQSAESEANVAWVAEWKARMGEDRVTNDPMEAHYIGFNMWANAVEQAGTTDVDAVRYAMYGQRLPNLTGGTAIMLSNHHLTKPVLIGEIQADGQFDIISQTFEVPGDPWTDFLPESSVLTSDWKEFGCGMHNDETSDCVQIKSNY